MDIFFILTVIIVFCIVFSICGWCCKRQREGTVYGQGHIPVTVAQQHVSASPVVVPPYPMEASHPMPQNTQFHPPAPGFVPQPAGYQTGGYPPARGEGYPPATGGYPPATGGYPPASAGYPPATAGYPPAEGYPPQPAPPPSYTEAVRQPPQMPPANELYSKQAPYNPNF